MLSTIVKTCMICNREASVSVDSASLYLYNQGEYVHNAFPDLSPADREIIISGTHGECWDSMFLALMMNAGDSMFGGIDE